MKGLEIALRPELSKSGLVKREEIGRRRVKELKLLRRHYVIMVKGTL